MRGFTLIETVVYIALLSLLMTGTVLSTFYLLQGASSVESLNATQDEGAFVLQKIEWALSGADVISTPASGNSSTLVLTRYDGDTITIRRTGTTIELRTNSGDWIPLTAETSVVSALSFTTTPGTPSLVAASTTINGVVFSTARLTY